ncbi:MAG: hypothetical protein ACYDAQ_12150 [Mycobacteriales bacterium]
MYEDLVLWGVHLIDAQPRLSNLDHRAAQVNRLVQVVGQGTVEVHRVPAGDLVLDKVFAQLNGTALRPRRDSVRRPARMQQRVDEQAARLQN